MISRINMCEKNQNSQSKTNNFLNKLFEKKQTKTHKFKYNILQACGNKTNIFKEKFSFPSGTYLLKFNNRNTTPRCKICSKLTIKTPEQLCRLRY